MKLHNKIHLVSLEKYLDMFIAKEIKKSRHAERFIS